MKNKPSRRKFLENIEQTIKWVLKQDKRLSRELILSLPNHEEILLRKMKKENQRREKMYHERSKTGMLDWAAKNPEKVTLRSRKGGLSPGAAIGRARGQETIKKKTAENHRRLFEALPDIFTKQQFLEISTKVEAGSSNMIWKTFTEKYVVKVGPGIATKPGVKITEKEIKKLIQPDKRSVERITKANELKSKLPEEFTGKEAKAAAVKMGLSAAWAGKIIQEFCIKVYAGVNGSPYDVARYSFKIIAK